MQTSQHVIKENISNKLINLSYDLKFELIK